MSTQVASPGQTLKGQLSGPRGAWALPVVREVSMETEIHLAHCSDIARLFHNHGRTSGVLFGIILFGAQIFILWEQGPE